MRRVLVLTLLCALTACSSSTPSAGPSGSAGTLVRTSGCGASAAADAADAADVAGRITQKGETDFASVFAGARVADVGVEVYRKPSADLDKWISSTFADACVIVYAAKFSAVELAARYQQVGDDNAYWAGQGVHVNSVSSDFVRGVVIVGTQEVALAREKFPARYGSGVPVEIVDEAPS